MYSTQRRQAIIAEQLHKGRTRQEADQRANAKGYYQDTFFVPARARWEHLRDELHHNVGDGLNKALGALEEDNTGLEGVLHHIDFTRTVGKSKLPDKKLRELIQHFNRYRLRNEDFEFPDLLGAAYEYLVGEFADSAGKKGGEFYTPRAVVRMMVRLADPQEGMRVYDPCSGSGGMLILSAEHCTRARRQPEEPRALRPGGQRRGLVHQQDEHDPARHPGRGSAQRRHPGRAVARRGRRADAVRPGHHQSALLPELLRRGHPLRGALPLRLLPRVR